MNEAYPDRTSKVPYYTFTEEYAEAQWTELAENPLLQRMNACRESLASDRYRPTYHYVNPEMDVELSMNFFHLRPGTSSVLILTPSRPLTAKQLRQTLLIRSLVDTYRVPVS